MNHDTNQKISKLIEESITQRMKNLLQKIGVLPKNILDKIIKKYRVKHLEETQTPAPKIEGTTNSRDTCLTAVLKLIGKEKLIDKYDSSYDFMKAYHAKNSNIIKLHEVKVENLKPGTVLFYKGPYENSSTVNRGYGKFGMEQQDEISAGHFEIYLGVDDTNKKNKYVLLGNQHNSDDRTIVGSNLELTLSYVSSSWMNKKRPEGSYPEYIEVLDYNTINKM